MTARHWKRSVIACSVLILGFAPVGIQQASAAAPTETHASAPAAVNSPRDYRQGFRDGFRDGYQDARDDCRPGGGLRSFSTSDYTRGYADGYSAGFARAERRYC
ncbi:hypothetical protein AB0N31_32930 [Streptomyces sp. NPDC051051]|uniref:hypothetical protein n=1 Tax=Streptomyces sp. NPDC051051 TaxID=3155666 RepID=UPI0034411A71